MLDIRPATPAEFVTVRNFYHRLIDMMADAKYKPGWEKNVYPTDAYIRQSIHDQQLYIGEYQLQPAAAMIVNHESNAGYHGVTWNVDAAAGEVTVIHALGVLPTFTGRGFAQSMVQQAITLAQQNHQKAIRLDVLAGNLPAERLYTGLGFQYIKTVPMYYEDTGWTDFLLYEYPITLK